MTERELRQAMEQGLKASLPPTVRADVLAQVREKEHVVKKKLSMAFVLMMILVLLATAAVAVGVSRAYLEGVADLQLSGGYYDDWSMNEKQAMVALLKEHGLVEADVSLRTEGEIDAYMIEHYGINGRSDVIGLTSILEKHLGSMSDWDNDTWIWYIEMMLGKGLITEQSDEDRFFKPGAEAAAPEEIIEKTKTMLMEIGDMTREKVDSATYLWHYKTRIQDTERKHLHYTVEVRVPDGENQRYFFFEFAPDGSSWEEDKTDLNVELDWEVREIIEGYVARENAEPNMRFERLSLEVQQEITDHIRPIVRKHMLDYPNYQDGYCAWFADHIYGVPDEKAITQAEAETIARGVMRGNGVDMAEVEAHSFFYVNYEITDPDVPLWKISWLYMPPDDFGAQVCYRVIMDAHSGQVVQEVTHHYGDGVTTMAQQAALNH